MNYILNSDILPLWFSFDWLDNDEVEEATKYIKDELLNIFPSMWYLEYEKDLDAFNIHIDYEELLDLIKPIEQHQWFYLEEAFYIDEEERDNLYAIEWVLFENLTFETHEEISLVIKYILNKLFDGYEWRPELLNT